MSEEAAAHAQEGRVTTGDLVATAALFGLFVVTFGLAVLFSRPFLAANYQAFEDPEQVTNALWYIGAIIAFTFIILALRKRFKWLIPVIILFAVGVTLAYVLFAVFAVTAGLGFGASLGLALAVAAAATAGLYFYPEWYVVDTVGVLVAAGAAAIFGISLAVWPVVVFLVLLAIYDAIAVYKTRHMLALADSVIEWRLPVLLVIPKHRGYSFLREASKFKDASAENKEEREAMFMGLGDLVMPTILVVSALHFGSEAGWGHWPAVGAAIGTLVGFLVLMSFVLRGNPQAGLPLLNGGAIAGFLVALYVATSTIVFW